VTRVTTRFLSNVGLPLVLPEERRSALAQGPDVPTTVPIPNPGQEQVEPAGGELRIRELPESVWQVAPITGAGGS